MKLLRFISPTGVDSFGLLDEGGTRVRECEGEMFGSFYPLPNTYALDDVVVLPPCEPTKIVCVGLNYRDHAREMGLEPPDEPLIFLKPPSAVTAHGRPIPYPDHMSSRVDFEGELAVVIGREARWIDGERWRDYVLGFTCMNDVTARDLQVVDTQYTRAKGFDGFAPLGPVIETELDPGEVEITTTVSGSVRQRSSTREMIFDVPRLLSFVTRVMTLQPGDVVATGTPAGSGPMEKGDTVEVSIEGIGTLRNTVV